MGLSSHRYLVRVCCKSAVTPLIEGTDHSFANRLGRASVLAHAQKWLHSWFPLPQSKGAAVSDTPIPAGSEERGQASQEHCQGELVHERSIGDSRPVQAGRA